MRLLPGRFPAHLKKKMPDIITILYDEVIKYRGIINSAYIRLIYDR